MKILLANGCSHTAGCEIEYKRQPECFDKAWPKFLADKLGYDHINLAKGGSSNYRIIRTTQNWIIKNVLLDKTYKSEDVCVIIMWSGFDRKEVYFHDTNVLDDINPLCKPEYINTKMVKEINALKDVIVYFHDDVFSNHEFITMFINFYEFLENNSIKAYFVNGIKEVLKLEYADNRHRLFNDYSNALKYIEVKKINYLGLYEESDVFFPHMSKISKIPMPHHVEFAHWGEDGQKYWADFLFKKFFTKKII